MSGRLVSFRGPIGAGKTTAAKILVARHGFVRVPFAYDLKAQVFSALTTIKEKGAEPVIARFSTETGLKIDKTIVEAVPSNLTTDILAKTAWIAERNDALRPLLQWWGTEYRRAENPRYWIDLWHGRADPQRERGTDVVVDDARFDNEIEEVPRIGGYHVFIDGSAQDRVQRIAERANGNAGIGLANHESERNLDPDDRRNKYVIENDGTIDDLEGRLKAILDDEETALRRTR